MKSKIGFLVCVAILLATHLYYPKWAKSRTEATISWDASGYYMYLPAFFIYKDIKGCGFQDAVLKKYGPTPDFQQAFVHKESGNHVMKYSFGQALVFSPFFAASHLWATQDDRYLADGFSFPYQLGISIGSLLLAIVGLFYLRRVLLEYFEDGIVALTMLCLFIGSNYLNYSAIDGAMTHNTLFTIYTILLWNTIGFYKKPNWLNSMGIGVCVGLAALVRPTEIISCIIPLAWACRFVSRDGIMKRWRYILDNKAYYLLAIIITMLIGSIQLIYWKYATGDWIVYSYEDQGFSWLTPHIYKGILSYRSGWLVYSPFMVFSLIGFIYLYKRKELFHVSLLFTLLFIYIVFAWDIWWYGGSLGQRTMVQAYPVLAFPLAAFMEHVLKLSQFAKGAIFLLGALFIYVNIWFTHQAHKGGMLKAGHMTGPYYWQTLLTWEKNKNDLKLLDHLDYIYEGDLLEAKEVYRNEDYNTLLTKDFRTEPIILNADLMSYPYDAIRINAGVEMQLKEWNFWRMTQFIVNVKNGDQLVENNMIRLQRLLSDNEKKEVNIDIKKPSKPFTHLEVLFWNAGDKPITIRSVNASTYMEE